MDIQAFLDFKSSISQNCTKVILGKQSVIDSLIVSFICSGHVLLEDVPGTGKTMLLRAFSKSIGGDFKRVQFTPDLLPSDLTGINFYNQKQGDFVFRKGPLFSNVILADEINRATPRTQASLLEAMEERQISVDGTTYALSEPFIVMATQNPIESSGTFPLPEAQIDRFFMRLSLGYMEREQELDVISRKSTIDIVESLKSVVTSEQIDYVKTHYSDALVKPEVASYIMDIVEKTRTDKRLLSGVSTRGAIALYKASQAFACINGRDFVLPEDVTAIAHSVLCHRMLSGLGRRSQDTAAYLNEIISETAVPLENI